LNSGFSGAFFQDSVGRLGRFLMVG